jgi:hypothetical protein
MADRVAVRSACRRPPLALATAGAYLDLHPLIAATGRLLGLAVVTEQKRTLRTGLGKNGQESALRPVSCGRCSSVRRAEGCPRGRSICSRAASRLERDRSRRRTSPGTRP